MDNVEHKSHRRVALVVDDDMAMRLLMRQSLEQAGLAIVEADNGEKALAAFKRVRPDLVLMDVRMPKMDGFTACSRLRQLPGGGDVTVVMVTGLEDIASIERAYDVGATDFITKPVNWPILNHRVRYLQRASEAFRALRRSEAQLSEAQRIARLGNWEWDIENDTVWASDWFFRIFGLEPQEYDALYKVEFNSVHPDDRTHFNHALHEALYHKEPHSFDFRIVRDGTERTVHTEAEVIFGDSGKPARMHGTVQDISERKKAEAQIRSLAYYDVLTGLPNRQLFKERAFHELAAARLKGTKVTLMFLDLDQFKYINDTLGHNAGDELLKQIAEILKQTIRTSDIVAKTEAEKQSAASLSQLGGDDFTTRLTEMTEREHAARASLARLGGDEFTILFTELTEREHAARVAQRILENLSLPLTIENREFFITGSIGIAVYPGDGKDLDALLKNADTAMYHAKDQGRNGFAFYEEKMNVPMLERLSMGAELKKALDRDELVLHYQPKVETNSGNIVGLEALVRWQHPEMGLIAPSVFIGIAEETGVIGPIGEWVLRTACAQARAWQQDGFIPLRMAVNLSSHQFRQRDLSRVVKQIMDTTHLDSHWIELELTESTIMRDMDDAKTMLWKLKETGVKLAIDDFGTGYSSMNYLKQFPLDILKIDRSFVKDIASTPEDAAIIKAIIALAKNLNLIVTAEGVEEEEQLTFLREQNCDEIQGHLISRPLPAEAAGQFLKASQTFRRS